MVNNWKYINISPDKKFNCEPWHVDHFYDCKYPVIAKYFIRTIEEYWKSVEGEDDGGDDDA